MFTSVIFKMRLDKVTQVLAITGPNACLMSLMSGHMHGYSRNLSDDVPSFQFTNSGPNDSRIATSQAAEPLRLLIEYRGAPIMCSEL